MKCNHYFLPESASEYIHCSLDGWPQLNGLCREHFEQQYLLPAIKEQIRADEIVMQYRTALYNVEVAQGLRPRIVELPTPSGRFLAGQVRSTSGTITGRITKGRPNVREIVANDEELG